MKPLQCSKIIVTVNHRRANVIEHLIWRKRYWQMPSSNLHWTITIVQTQSRNIVVQTLSDTRFTQMSFRHTPSNTCYPLKLIWQLQLFNCYEKISAVRAPSIKCSWTNVTGQRSSCKLYLAFLLAQTLPNNAVEQSSSDNHHRTNAIGHTLYTNIVSTHIIRIVLSNKLDMTIAAEKMFWKKRRCTSAID